MNSKIIHIFKIFKQPYPLYLEFSKTFPVIVGISLFVPLFLLLFKPFGLTADDIRTRPLFIAGFGLVTFIILSVNLYVLPRLFSQVFEEDKWTVGREIAWILWNVFAAVTGAAAFEFIQPDCPFTLLQLVKGYSRGFLMSIIPVVIIVLLTYMSLLKNRLQRAEKITQNLTAQASHKTNSKIKLVSENNTDTLILSPEDLLVIQSSDNYSTIIWEEGLEIKKTLLRSTLKRLAAQIKFAHIVRCHRSYIVNLMRVYSVSGNANGYKLYLKGYPEAVPVARGYGKEVMQILERISS